MSTLISTDENDVEKSTTNWRCFRCNLYYDNGNAVPRVGMATALITLIVGQMTTSLLIDHFGLIGDKIIPIDFKKICGVLLMGMAIYLFYKK